MEHERNRRSCGASAIAARPPGGARAHLPLALGGLGLVSGQQALGGGRHTGRFGLTLFLRCTGAATQVVADVGHQDDNISVQLACIAALTRASPVLRKQGFAPPPWAEVARGGRAAPHGGGRDFGGPLRGWQRSATASLDKTVLGRLCRDLDPASRALLLSQAGLGGPQAVVAVPTAPEFRLPSDCMRVAAAAPPSAFATCAPPMPLRGQGRLDVLGDHRSACPTAGVLGQLREIDAKQALESPAMSSCVADLRCWPMACRFGKAPKWPWTPH